MKKQNGFTLVELLAVIVILAIILVIAVPQIMDTIESSRKASLESSVKMVASSAETQYTVAQTLDNLGTGEGQFNAGSSTSKVSCLTAKWAGLNTTDYATCEYYIDSNGVAHVDITGKTGGKFAGYTCANGDKSSATCNK